MGKVRAIVKNLLPSLSLQNPSYWGEMQMTAAKKKSVFEASNMAMPLRWRSYEEPFRERTDECMEPGIKKTDERERSLQRAVAVR